MKLDVYGPGMYAPLYTAHMEDIQADLFALDAWAGRNDLLLNMAKCQQLHIGGLPPYPRPQWKP